MTSRCDDFVERADGIALGDREVSPADAQHLASCASCRGVLQRARAIEAALAARPVPEPPAAFTTHVMAAVRRDRWRAEQVLDLGFNLAIATGVLLIAAGLLGLAWRTGLIVIGGDLATLVTAGVSLLAERAAAQAQNVLLAMLLLTTALGVWWWAEGIEV